MFWANVRPPADEWLGDSTGATTLALTLRTPFGGSVDRWVYLPCNC